MILPTRLSTSLSPQMQRVYSSVVYLGPTRPLDRSSNYTVGRSLLVTENATVVADLGIASTWMAFDPNNLSFNGNVPQDLAPGPIGIALYATLGHETDEVVFRINMIRRPTTTSPHTITSSAPATSFSSIAPSSSTSSTTANRSHLSRSTRLKIILSAVLSTVALFFS